MRTAVFSSRGQAHGPESSLEKSLKTSFLHPFTCVPRHAGGNARGYMRQSSTVERTVISPPSAYFDPRVHQHSFHPHALPAPVLAGSAAHIHPSSRDDTSYSALINFAGTICLGIVAAGYASPDALKTSRLLDTSVACGIIGCLSTLAALFLDRHQGAQCFLSLSLFSAAVGTVTMVAATQTWEFAVLASICITMTAGTVWKLRARRLHRR